MNQMEEAQLHPLKVKDRVETESLHHICLGLEHPTKQKILIISLHINTVLTCNSTVPFFLLIVVLFHDNVVTIYIYI